MTDTGGTFEPNHRVKKENTTMAKKNSGKKSAEMGMNRTGLDTSPKMSREMVESVSEYPIAEGYAVSAVDVRTAYILEGATVGSMPPPASLKGAAKTAMKALKGERASVLIDKLAERLAFERSGTRLYEALMIKHKALGAADGSATIEQLEQICRDELNHFQLLWDCLKELGADPTVETPSADVSALASQGIPKVVTDPRTTFAQCLQAILVAELVDHDGWDMLIEVANDLNQTEMVTKFRQALAEEETHLTLVRSWLKHEIKNQAHMGAS